MKKYNIIITLFLSVFVYTSYGQVLIGTTIPPETPDASAALEIGNTSKGILLPKVSLSDVTDASSPIDTPATSLIVYNTNAAVTGGNGIGFYYFNGALWIPFSSASSWDLNGNSTTNAATNYIGTTDAQDFVIKTDDIEAMRITPDGHVGIGTNAPTAKLHISSLGSEAVLLDVDFEDGTLGPLSIGGDRLWEISSNAFTGAFAAETPNSVNNNFDTAWMEYDVTILDPGAVVSFAYETSTEVNSDWFRFYIDGAAEVEASGINPYTTVSVPLSPGTQTLRWEYQKDNNGNGGNDQVYVDDILIIEVGDAAIRIADGTEGVNKILKTDASGNASWENPVISFTDDDWDFNSGSTNLDPIHHVGPILINQSSYFNAVSDFYVNNGLTIGTQIGFGSSEFIIDDLNATLFSDGISPLVDQVDEFGHVSLGDDVFRWGDLYSTNGYTTMSDRSLKTAIEPIQYGTNDLMNLNPVSYKWKDRISRTRLNKQALIKSGQIVKPANDDTVLGLVAQELNEIIPEVVHTYTWKKDEKGNPIKVPMETMGVSYSDLIPVLIKSIQEQQILLEAIEKDQEEISKAVLKK